MQRKVYSIELGPTLIFQHSKWTPNPHLHQPEYTIHPNPLRHSDPVRQALCAAEQAQTCLPGQRALNEACSCQLCSQIRPHLADKCDKCRIRKVFRHHLSMCELLYPSQRHQLPELLLRPRLEHVQLPGGEESLLEYVTQC